MKIWRQVIYRSIVSKCKYLKKYEGGWYIAYLPMLSWFFSDVHVFCDGNHGLFQNGMSLLLEYILKPKITLKNSNFWRSFSFSATLTSSAMVAFSFSLTPLPWRPFLFASLRKWCEACLDVAHLILLWVDQQIHLRVPAPAEPRPVLAAALGTAVTGMAGGWALSTEHHVHLCSYLQHCQEILSARGPQLS